MGLFRDFKPGINYAFTITGKNKCIALEIASIIKSETNFVLKLNCILFTGLKIRI